MSYASRWTLTKGEFKKLCDKYKLDDLVEVIGFSKSYISKKRKEFGLVKD